MIQYCRDCGSEAAHADDCAYMKRLGAAVVTGSTALAIEASSLRDRIAALERDLAAKTDECEALKSKLSRKRRWAFWWKKLASVHRGTATTTGKVLANWVKAYSDAERERDEARAEVERMRGGITSGVASALDSIDRVKAERDEAGMQAQRYERDWIDAKAEFDSAMSMVLADLDAARANMLVAHDQVVEVVRNASRAQGDLDAARSLLGRALGTLVWHKGDTCDCARCVIARDIKAFLAIVPPKVQPTELVLAFRALVASLDVCDAGDCSAPALWWSDTGGCACDDHVSDGRQGPWAETPWNAPLRRVVALLGPIADAPREVQRETT